MDPVAVDRLTRTFVTAGTRRRLLALLGLLPLAGATLFLQADPAEAGGRRHRRKRRHNPGEDKRHRKGKQKGKHKGKRQQAPPPSPPTPPTPCVPNPQSTCAAEGRVCGSIGDGCDGTLDCGTCGPCQMCNGTGQCVADPGQNRTTCDGSGTATSVCCNGECCSGCCSGDGSCGACRVFVTSTKHDGNLKGSSASGLAGADDICQQLAESASRPLPGDYQAWLSDSTGSPSTRFRCTAASCSAEGYVLVDGTTVVAADWDDLTTCSGTGPGGAGTTDCLRHAIDHTEQNASIGSQNNVWSHTETDGAARDADGVHCQGWTTNNAGQSGDFGIPFAAGNGDVSWTRWGSESCANSVRLYCFQQR
jgi:hypothetical protein